MLTETTRTAEFLVSEANGDRAREQIIVAYGSDLEPGTVLGEVTTTGKYKRLDPDATDGSESATAVLYGHAPASGGDVRAVAIARDAVVVARALKFASGVDSAAQQLAIASLAERGIVAR